MNEPNKGYERIKDVINELIYQEGETTRHLYPRFKSFAREFVRDWYTGYRVEPKAVILNVKANKTVDLPDDYIDYTVIGYQVGQRVMPFFRDDKLAKYYQEKCGNKIANTEPIRPDELGDQGYQFGFGFHNYINLYGEHTGGEFGFGNSKPHSFTITGNQIALSSEVTGSQIYMEYVSSSHLNSDTIYIPNLAAQALKYYVMHRHTSHDRDRNEYEISRWKREFHAELNRATLQAQKITTEDILNIVRSEFRMSPKI